MKNVLAIGLAILLAACSATSQDAPPASAAPSGSPVAQHGALLAAQDRGIRGPAQGDRHPAARGEAEMSELTIAVVGLGYVGLPLAIAFGRRFATLGYDISRARVDELSRGAGSGTGGRAAEPRLDELRRAFER